MIVNGQSMTIVGVAPKGFTGTTLGIEPKVFVPITMRAEMQPFFKAFDNRRSYWAYLFGRLKPGVSIDQARAAINVQYHAIINNVEAPLQKGMSDATMEKFKARQVDAGARRAGTEQCAHRGSGAAHAALRRHGLRAAHRLREHREPPAGARRRAQRRNGRPALDRREPRAAHPPAALRVVPARPPGRSRRAAGGEVDARDHRRASCRTTRPSPCRSRSIRRSCSSPSAWHSQPASSSDSSPPCTARAPIWPRR